LNVLYEASSPERQQQPGGGGRTVKKVDKATIVALALLFVSIWVILAAGVAAVWLTAEVRVFGLVILPTGIVAGLLVVYFAWRDNLRRRALAERSGHRTAA
jgi:hypothetical protein